MDDCLDRFARGIATVVNILDPDVIVLGGGLSNIAALYDELPARVERYCFHSRGADAIVKNTPRRFQRRARRGLAVGEAEVAALADERLLPRLPARRAAPAKRCAACGGRRLLSHAELDTLVHRAYGLRRVLCRDREARRSCAARQARHRRRRQARGVVSTACYIARIYGVRSAMPMFKALKLCPHAVVVQPRHSPNTADAGRADPRA